jgi:hypothetical protein
MRWTPLRRGLAAFVSIFGFFSVAINLTPNNWLNLYRLAESDASTQATVTAIHPENHRTCDFAYAIDGRSFTHSESCHLFVGEVSPLTYLPSEPSAAIVRSPDEELEASIFVPLGISVVFGILTALGTWLAAWRLASKID